MTLRSAQKSRAAAALVAVALALTSVPTPVFAHAAPTAEEVQQAQARWNEGKAAFEAANYEAARLAFKQAYSVLPHPAFLQNIGESELRTGRLVDAARHLSQYLRTASSSATQRDAATRSLKKAAERLGAVVVETNVDDAEVRVDDEVVGKSPLGSAAWYVEPGSHSVVIRKEGYADATGDVNVQSGETKTVSVTAKAPAGPSGASGKLSAPAGGDLSGRTSEAGAAAPSGAGPGFFQPRTVVILGGAVLAVASVGIGAAYAIKVGSDTDAYDAAVVHKNEVAGTSSSACAGTDDGSARALACRDVRDSVDQIDRDRALRNAGFIAAGVVGAATAATFLLWRPSRDGRTATVAIAPSVGPHERGVGIVGSF